jgi:hypothetical protein
MVDGCMLPYENGHSVHRYSSPILLYFKLSLSLTTQAYDKESNVRPLSSDRQQIFGGILKTTLLLRRHNTN